MTTDVVENSTFNGSPVELYRFTRGAISWRYTSSDEDLTVDGEVFNNVPIKRSAIEQSQDSGKNSITLDVPRNLSFITQYIESPPTDSIELLIRRLHRTDVDEEVVVIWTGRVVNVKFSENKASIKAEPMFTALKRPALRRLFSTTCPHLVYGPVCRASRSIFDTVTTVTVLSNTSLQSNIFSSRPDQYYTGGVVEFSINGVINKRLITNHAANIITLNLPLDGISTGSEVTVAPGCDRTLNSCINKFNNVVNYGGFPYSPRKNPFSGDPIF